MKYMIIAWESDAAARDEAQRRARASRHTDALNRVAHKQGGPGAAGIALSFGLGYDAKTIRRDRDKLLVLDGPFAETKEQLAGFDIIEFASRADAVEYARDASADEGDVTEIRPVLEMWWNQRGRLPAGAKLFVLLFRDVPARPASCGGGDAIVRQRAAAAAEYVARQGAADGFLLGAVRLASPSEAIAVRLRRGRYSATDGPFAETREMLGGLNILTCASLDEALAWAGKFSSRDGGAVEVREIRGGGSFFYHG
jgi:hypothetical protein